MPLDLAQIEPGDVVLFRLWPGCPMKHAAILSEDGRMIHAQSGDRVREVTMGTEAYRGGVRVAVRLPRAGSRS